MRYIFLALLLVNIGAFGYFSFLHKADNASSVAEAKQSLSNEVSFTNVSSELPPEIGKK